MNEYENVVIDTTVWIGKAVAPNGPAAEAVQKAQQTYEVVHSKETMRELETRLQRQKFDQYIPSEQKQTFLQEVRATSTIVPVTQQVTLCRDPNDNMFLSLAVSAGAKQIITNDKDLLVLDGVRGIAIQKPEQFLARERELDKRREPFLADRHVESSPPLKDREAKEFQHLRTHQKEKAREQESARQDRARAAREQLERKLSLEDQERRPKGFAVLVEKVRNTLDPERAGRLMQERDQEKRLARSALERRLSEDRRKEIRDLARTNVDEKSRFRDAARERRQFAEREMQRLQELSRGAHERTGSDRSR